MEADYESITPEAEAFLAGLSGRLRLGPFADVDVYCVHRSGSTVCLRNIGVRGQRGTGKGTAAMEALMDLADETGADLHIQPSGDDDAGTARLEGWYRRLGCVDDTEPGRLSYVPGSRHAPRP